MNSTELHDRFRSEVQDQSAVPLWTSDEIYEYIDDAQKMFCRLQGGISDATSALTVLSITTGQLYVSISPLILKIRGAWRAADNYEIEILNYEDMGRRGTTSDYGNLSMRRIDESEGPVCALVAGMEANKLRLIQIPTANQSISILIYRMPRLKIDAPGQALEIDEQHHRPLLHWMKHLAHQKQDAETFDRGRSQEFEAKFVKYCDQAKGEREKREHKYRAVAYGGY